MATKNMRQVFIRTGEGQRAGQGRGIREARAQRQGRSDGGAQGVAGHVLWRPWHEARMRLVVGQLPAEPLPQCVCTVRGMVGADRRTRAVILAASTCRAAAADGALACRPTNHVPALLQPPKTAAGPATTLPRALLFAAALRPSAGTYALTGTLAGSSAPSWRARKTRASKAARASSRAVMVPSCWVPGPRVPRASQVLAEVP